MCSDNIFQPKFYRPKMETIQLDPKKHSLSIVSIDIPVITRPDEVVVKVAYAGICGTDIHVIAGYYPSSQVPFTLGHEFSGTVYAVGSEVKHFKRGDRVVVDPNKGCGMCRYCHTGKCNLCPTGSMNSALGIFANGGWAQFCKVSSQQIHKLPSTITFKQAVLLEPLSCIYHGYSRISPIHQSNNILITGAGIAGNLWCSLLHHVGQRNVIVSEPEQDRRELNKKLDTGFKVVTPSELNTQFQTDGENGVDVCIDCSGNGKVIENDIELLNRGGKLCIFGVAGKDTKVSISPFNVFLRELTIYGAAINPYTFQHTIGLAEAMGSRYLDYDKLGVKVFTMNEYKEALEELKFRKISKAVFKVDSTVE